MITLLVALFFAQVEELPPPPDRELSLALKHGMILRGLVQSLQVHSGNLGSDKEKIGYAVFIRRVYDRTWTDLFDGRTLQRVSVSEYFGSQILNSDSNTEVWKLGKLRDYLIKYNGRVYDGRYLWGECYYAILSDGYVVVVRSLKVRESVYYDGPKVHR